MSHHSETPFDNIESSHEYVSLLAEAIEVALAEVEADIAVAGQDSAERQRKEAAATGGVQAESNFPATMTASRRILI